jgi:hypothetical protein
MHHPSPYSRYFSTERHLFLQLEANDQEALIEMTAALRVDVLVTLTQ